jgi:hypothetical protein
MARRLIPKLERLLHRGEDVRGRLRELDVIKDSVIGGRRIYGR